MDFQTPILKLGKVKKWTEVDNLCPQTPYNIAKEIICRVLTGIIYDQKEEGQGK